MDSVASVSECTLEAPRVVPTFRVESPGWGLGAGVFDLLILLR